MSLLHVLSWGSSLLKTFSWQCTPLVGATVSILSSLSLLIYSIILASWGPRYSLSCEDTSMRARRAMYSTVLSSIMNAKDYVYLYIQRKIECFLF